jgi:uncharacterized membrane protein YgdD (TMEM256/DUF423 family)
MWLMLGSLNLALAVALGAFGAHGLKARLSAEQLAWWHTGCDYHFIHALGLLGLGVLAAARPELGFSRGIGLSLLAGILIFCGSLYAMALGAPRWFGAITPLGGAAFMIGWLWLAAAAWQKGL